MAPVTSIPTTIAATISRKCRQNGDTCDMWPDRNWLAMGFPREHRLTPGRKLPLESGFGP
jgi:hypothetical protein